jgi:hypothetical protein
LPSSEFDIDCGIYISLTEGAASRSVFGTTIGTTPTKNTYTANGLKLDFLQSL